MTTKWSKGRKAKVARRIAALACFASFMIFLISAGTALSMRQQWIEKVQIIPVTVASSIVTLLFWMLFTLVFGRIYCSIICPMGVWQDIVSRMLRLRRHRVVKRPYSYLAPRNSLRYMWLAMVVFTGLAGSTLLLTLFDPQFPFKEIIYKIFRPVIEGNATGTLVIGTLGGILGAAALLLVISAFAALLGRSYCNTLCPVGSALSIASRYSLYGIDINTDLCTGCTACEMVCKAHCINMSDHTIDTSRCVVCFDCLDVCRPEAISYTNRRHRLSTPLLMKVGNPQTGMINPETTYNTPLDNNDETISQTP